MFANIVRSEWLKVRTARGHVTSLVAAVVALVTLGPLAAWVTVNATMITQLRALDPFMLVNSGLGVAGFVCTVFGIGFGAREFSSGLAPSTFVVVPRRLPVLWAKLLVVTVVIGALTAGGLALAQLAGMHILNAGGLPSVVFTDPAGLRAQAGTVFGVAGNAAMGVALGMWLRSFGLAVAVQLGGVMVAPSVLAGVLPEPLRPLLRFLPEQAAAAFAAYRPDPTLLAPTVGLAVYAGWLALTVVAAAHHLRGNDI